MRGLASLIVVSFVLAGAVPVYSQGILDGPLAAPGRAVTPKVSAASSKRHKKPARHVAQTPAVPVVARDMPERDPRPAPQAPVKKAADDPLSLGMKWNGSNDNGSQTRVQNYNGAAPGTGAEVGLKLHF